VELANRMEEYFGKQFLELVNPNENSPAKNYWLKVVLQKWGRYNHPIPKLLMMLFLGKSMKDFEEMIVPEGFAQPFGKCPWLCLNPVADHYNQPVITDIKITTNRRNIRGEFSCSCGFVYSKMAYEERLDKKEKITIIQRGPVWENKLKQLIGKVSKTAIMRELNVDYKNNWIDKLGFPKEVANRSFKEELTAKQRSDREAWKRLKDNNPTIGRQELGKIDPLLYSRLYTNDRGWLYSTSVSSKIDWNKRDRETLKKVEKAVKEILDLKIELARVSINNILKYSDLKEVVFESKKLNMMPLTKLYVSAILETREEFEKRSIKWAVQYLQTENIVKTKEKVRKVRKLSGCSRSPKASKLIEIEENKCSDIKKK
jgi:hypothetical protein